MKDVATIRPTEPARVDRGRLEELVHEYGLQGAERLMGRVLEDLAVRLNRAERAWRRGDLVRLCHGARELSDVADRIGFAGLKAVAADVSALAIAGDAPALAATVARMMRLGEASLMSAWDLQDMTV